LAREWNAVEYEEISEAVLDAGCGTGRVTELLLERLHHGSVLAVDGSAAMVESARERFSGDSRVWVERQDLLELEVDEDQDLIFSTATFHWIQNHERLFENLAKALKPGGQLVAQCGGEGNISRSTQATSETMNEERFRKYFEDWTDDKHYANARDTKQRLEDAGFEFVETWLHDEPTSFGSVEELARFLETVVLGGHMLRLPQEERGSFASSVAAKIGGYGEPPTLDYVRLNMLAVRA
jgi:trans-aconitate 2-methyltransferase